MPGGAGWMGDGSKSAPAGSTFLVGAELDLWQGYVVQADGTPARIDADFSKGLVKDTDFTADCATDAKRADALSQHLVLLASATLYPNKDFSGAACTLDAGTELTNYAIGGSNDGVSVSSPEVKSKCAVDQAYSKTLIYGELVAK